MMRQSEVTTPMTPTSEAYCKQCYFHVKVGGYSMCNIALLLAGRRNGCKVGECNAFISVAGGKKKYGCTCNRLQLAQYTQKYTPTNRKSEIDNYEAAKAGYPNIVYNKLF